MPTVLITGANRGLGLEFAKQYKNKGFTVIATARHPQEAKELNSLEVKVLELDIEDQKSIDRLSKELKGTPIDILINNGGIYRGKDATLETLSPKEMTESFAVNSNGPLFVTQALMPNLRAGKDKKVVNISSQLGSIELNTGGMYPYKASKAALNQITKSMALDLAKEGFIVIAMHPGWVQTDMGGEAAPYTPEESISGMIQVIGHLSKSSNSQFLDLEGRSVPW